MKLPLPLRSIMVIIFALVAAPPAMDGGDSTLSTDSLFLKDSVLAKDSVLSKDSTVSVVAIKNTPEPAVPLTNVVSLGGNLSKLIVGGKQPYFITSDIYVPSGKTVTLEPGTVLLFKNFTGMHVEGRLIAEGTVEKPIVFSSEFDESYNPGAKLHANPYDWNGIYIHESGIGSILAHCKISYSVYGVTALTKYIKFDSVRFLSNGREDLTIEGKKPQVTAEPYSYTLTVNDARRDGIPVDILMDPSAKKRKILRYAGLSLLAGGGTGGLLWGLQAGRDKKRLVDLTRDLVHNGPADYDAALRVRNTDIALSVTSFVLAALGGAGLGFSFTF
jgi:hypothetical protein